MKEKTPWELKRGRQVRAQFRAIQPMFLVCHEHRLAYLSIAKCASSSFHRLMEGFCEPERLSVSQVLSEYPDYVRFTVIRNPLARLVSAHREYRKPNPRALLYRFAYDFPCGRGFGAFVKMISGVSDDIADPHFRSQYRFLYSSEHGVAATWMLRLERLEEAWETMQREAGMSDAPKLPFRNRGAGAAVRSYEDYYNEETEALARERYALDLAVWGDGASEGEDSLFVPLEAVERAVSDATE